MTCMHKHFFLPNYIFFEVCNLSYFLLCFLKGYKKVIKRYDGSVYRSKIGFSREMICNNENFDDDSATMIIENES